MIKEDYYARRAKLVSDYRFLLSKHCNRSAAARVRQIAELDLEYDGTPIEKTKAIFEYDSLMKK